MEGFPSPYFRSPSKARRYIVNTSLLAQELAPLNAQIDLVRQKHERLAGELRVVEAELETFSADKQRYDALKDVCNAFDKE